MSSFQVSPKWKFWNDDGWQQSAQLRLNMTDQSKTTINVFSPPKKRIGIKGKTNQLTVLFFPQPSSATWEGSLCPLYHWMPLLTSPTCLGSQTHTRKSNVASQSNTPRANTCCSAELASSQVSGKPPELMAPRRSGPYLPYLCATQPVKSEQIRAHGLLMTGWASDRVLELCTHSRRYSEATAS